MLNTYREKRKPKISVFEEGVQEVVCGTLLQS